MHCKLMLNDMKPLNEFIHWGNTLKMDFTEKEFHNYRTAVMTWLSDYWQKRENPVLSQQYFSKLVDVINQDGELAHVAPNANNQDLHVFRQTQLAAIMTILAEYKSNSTIRWANIRSWVSLVIAFLSFIISLATCK